MFFKEEQKLKVLKLTISCLLIFILFYSVSNAQHGRVNFFNNQNAFNSVCPGLALEDFEDTDLPPNVNQVCPPPFIFNSDTNNICYSEGALIPGFSISTLDTPFPNNALVVYTPNTFGVSNVAVGALLSGNDSPELTFTDSVDSVGLVLVGIFGNTTLDIKVFGVNDDLLGETSLTLMPTDGTFIGIVASEPIIRIEFNETEVSELHAIYDLSFGLCASRTIPTLSEWGLIAMAGILGIVGFMVIRRRKVTA